VPGGGPVGAPETGLQAYKGKLVDEASKPISGIFPMTFQLFPGLKARKAVWTETLWVAVDRGIYTVHLGSTRPLPARGDLEKMVLAVNIKGVGELVREPFVPSDVKPPVLAAGAPHPPVATAPAAPAPTPARAGGAKFADTAGFAVEADHAKNSDRLMNLTVDDIVRRAAEEGGGSAGGGAKGRLGGAKRYGGRVGGTGGTSEYNESCPKGYVMTGIRGAYGQMIDSIQIICSPIE